MQSGFLRLEVDGRHMPAYLSGPDGPGPYPGVVVAMHVFGLDLFTRGKCDELAEAGFVAIAPYLFHRTSVSHQELGDFDYADSSRWDRIPELKGSLRDDEIIADMLTAMRCLDAMDEVTSKIGVTGFCIGGRIALLMATATDEFKACADFYGGDVDQAWGGDISPLGRIPDLSCSLAGYFGNDDYNPTSADVDTLERALQYHGKDYEFHRYDGANHAFNDSFNPDRWRENAGKDSMFSLIEFFRRKLV